MKVHPFDFTYDELAKSKVSPLLITFREYSLNNKQRIGHQRGKLWIFQLI